ncbi:MAG: AI-2E family transporter [Actinomycetales bacterium]
MSAPEHPATPASAPDHEGHSVGHPDGVDGGRDARSTGGFTERLAALTTHVRRGRRAEPESESPTVVVIEEPTGAPRPGHSVPAFVMEAGAWSWRLLSIGAVLFVSVSLLTRIPIVTIPFIVAMLFTAVLGPVQRWLSKTVRLPHGVAALVALLIGVAALAVIGNFLYEQVTTNLPRMAAQLGDTINRLMIWLQEGPLQVSDAQVGQLSLQAQDVINRNQEALLSGALSTLSTVSHAIGGALLVLLATFFLLRDGELIWGWALSILPRQARPRINYVGRFGWRTLGGFVRGQTIIAALHAITVFIVLVVLDVPLAPALAILVFLGSYVPILGMMFAGTLCVVVALIENGPVSALVVAITILILIQLEAHLLQPLIMARTVEVHPLGVAMAVLAGTSLGGIAGALFAVPLVAFLNAAIRAANMPLPGSVQPGDSPVAVDPATDGQAGDDRASPAQQAPADPVSTASAQTAPDRADWPAAETKTGETLGSASGGAS